MASRRKFHERFALASRVVHRHRSRRPVLEILEDRALMAALTVNSLGDAGSGSGNAGDLRYCINQANSDDQANTIVFDPTVFKTSQSVHGGFGLSDTAGPQTITGPAAGVTIYEFTGAGSPVFQLAGGVTASISGATIDDTVGSYSAPSVALVNRGVLTLDHCNISGNSPSPASYAAGVGGMSNSGTLDLTDCTISGGGVTGGNGGGLYNSGTANLTGCIISGNSTVDGSGGGIFNSVAGNLTLTDCTISGNTTLGPGGGVFNAGTARLTSCTVNGNSVPSNSNDVTIQRNTGGGIYNRGTAILTDCTVSGNTAGLGGGMYNYAAAYLKACTLSGNSGGGLYNSPFIPGYGGGSVELTDTIVAGNSGDISGYSGVVGGTVTGTNNLIGTGGSGGLVNGVGGNIVLTNLSGLGLAPLGNYGGPTQTFALLPGSLAIGAGTAIGGLTADQRGDPLDSPNPDIGAFQSQGFTLTPVAGSTPQSAAGGTAFANPLAVTVSAKNPVEPVVGGVLTFTAPVSGPSAKFSASTATISSSGVASVIATANFSAGSYTVTASAGGGNATAKFALTNTASSRIPSSTSLSSSLNPSAYGQAVTLTATVTPGFGIGTPGGSVTFYDGSTALGTATLASEKASLQTTTLPAGIHSISAVYSGDSNDAPSTSSMFVQTVNQDSTTTTVTCSVNPSVYGQLVTFTASVKAAAPGSGTPTGTITFYDGTTKLGTVTLTAGAATCTTAQLPTGHDSITGIYEGSSSFTASTSAALTQTVNQASTAIQVTSTLNPSVHRQAVRFTATVKAVAPGSGMPTGIVTFYNGTTVLGIASVSDGIATFITSSLSVGTHSIKAVYSGDTNFKRSTSAILKQVVNAAHSHPSLVSPVNSTGIVLATLPDESDLGVPLAPPRKFSSHLAWTRYSHAPRHFLS